MTSILVTGGAGYIGSQTCKALRAAGYTPITYDNLARGNPEAVKWGALEIGDLADGQRLRETFTRHRLAAVIHFAVLAYVGESNENPAAYWRQGSGGTWKRTQIYSAQATRPRSNSIESDRGLDSLLDHDLFRKPVSTFSIMR
jgi:UDP-glucose 4-epimerase